MKKLNASGTLFNSYKQHDGMNSVVGVLTDEGSEFEVLLFEIEIFQELQNVKKINNDLQPPSTNDL